MEEKLKHLDRIRETWGTVGAYVKAVWGDSATFDVCAFTAPLVLIHLDAPDSETRHRRCVESERRFTELKNADCPLCREMAEVGGDEVFESTPTDKVNA